MGGRQDSPESAPPATIVLDSDDFGARHDMRPWRETVAREVLGIDYRPVGDTPFRARMTVTAMGDTLYSAMQCTPADTLRDRSLLDTKSGNFVFGWTQGAAAIAGQRGRETVIRPGEGLLLTAAELGHINMRKGGTLVAALLPRGRLEAAIPDIEDRVMTTLGRNSAGLALVQGYCRLIEGQAARASLAARQLMGEHLADLIVLALTQDRETAAPRAHAAAQARMEIVRAVIAERAHDPGLTLSELATACGLSPRSVQLLFEQSGSSYTRYLLDLRLEQAHRLLNDPACKAMRIIDIALAAGFSDISYFNRTFRARFGETPTAARRV